MQDKCTFFSDIDIQYKEEKLIIAVMSNIENIIDLEIRYFI